MNSVRRAARDQYGFSMITVMVAMLIAGLFVTGAFAAADGDLPIGKRSQDRKEARAAAEAGVNFYAFHLAQDDRYWTRCSNVPAPNATEPSPVVPKWYGGAPATDTRTGHWRAVPGSGGAQYSIELLSATVPTAGNPTPQCIEGDEPSMLDPATGMLRIRVTGRSGSSKRSIIASFRRKGLLDFIWLTNYETQDPNNYPPNGYPFESYKTPSWAATNCTDYRGARSTNCEDQQFASGDQLLGPLHSNDSLWTCNGSTFGRPGKRDKLEVSASAPGWYNQCGTTSPNFNSPFYTGQQSIEIPETNTALATIAQAGGRLLTGKHFIRLDADRMQIDNSGIWEAQPANGVLYVQTGVGGCASKPPLLADYAESASCGNVYISGTYSRNLTIAAQNDVIIGPTLTTSPASDNLVRQSGSSAVLGLIAENFVRVMHRVVRQDPSNPDSCTNLDTAANPNLGDITIEAAIMSVQHSFTVDNYGCGASEGDLTVNGAIAQNFRGTVGRVSGPGYIKDYHYDDLLKLRSPPYFLSPLATPWLIARTNEQVPAT
jgi:hypothetical protein